MLPGEKNDRGLGEKPADPGLIRIERMNMIPQVHITYRMNASPAKRPLVKKIFFQRAPGFFNPQ